MSYQSAAIVSAGNSKSVSNVATSEKKKAQQQRVETRTARGTPWPNLGQPRNSHAPEAHFLFKYTSGYVRSACEMPKPVWYALAVFPSNNF